MPAYRTYQTTTVDEGGLAPTSLLQPMGTSLEGGLGDVKDALSDTVKLGVLARCPGISPTDGLTAVGVERQVLRGPTESDADYSARLVAAWATWPYGGTPFGVLIALYYLGYPNVYLMPVRGSYIKLNSTQTGIIATPESYGVWKIDANANPAPSQWAASATYAAAARVGGGNGYIYEAPNGGVTGLVAPIWPTSIGSTVIDGSITWSCAGVDFWSRFDVIFSPVPASWNPTPPVSGSDEMNRIRLALQQWKPAFATVNQIAAVVSGKVWGWPVTTVWGAGSGNWGASNGSVTYYTP